MLTVLAVVLKVHLNSRPAPGLATTWQETWTVACLATSYTSCWPGEQEGESGERVTVERVSF